MTGRLRSAWTRIDGRVLHARVAEAPPAGRPPVVLVHGLVVSSRYMAPAVRALAPRFPAAAPDLPGHGRSTKPRRALDVPGYADALAGWMRATGRAPALLLGNSMGCQIVVDLAAREPDLALGLVLAGPTMDARARAFPPQVARLALDSLREPLPLVLTEARDLLDIGPRRALQAARHALRDAPEAKAPRVRCPVLVLRGDRDPIVPRAWAEDLAARFPRATYREIPGPHVLNWASADALAEAVERWAQAEGLTI